MMMNIHLFSCHSKQVPFIPPPKGKAVGCQRHPQSLVNNPLLNYFATVCLKKNERERGERGDDDEDSF